MSGLRVLWVGAATTLAACVEIDPCATLGGDVDGDGVCSAFDNCVVDANSDQADGDADGIGDACDVAGAGTVCAGRGHDDDADQVCSAFDNCPDTANPDQRDDDRDGYGNACDDTPRPCDALGGDADGDTVCDDVDNCPDTSNITQVDLDSDGVGDVCDPEPPPVPNGDPCAGLGGDVDEDGVCTVHDNCPEHANRLQADVDGNGLGDACDTERCDGLDNDGDGTADEGYLDGDGDGLADCVDACPRGPNADADEDGLADCLDPCLGDPLNDLDGDGVCTLSDNCPLVPNGGADGQGDADGDGLGDACDAEACDGVDNDGDGRVDEDQSDRDDDGLCDLVDPCPDDPYDDEDGDGVCYAVDLCHAVYDPEQLDEDGNGWGDACDLYGDLECGDAALASAPGARPLPSVVDIAAIDAVPGSDVVYVAFSSESLNLPNEVAAVHAPTSSVLWSVFVGGEPSVLARSSDGRLLYVGKAASTTIQVIQTAERRACRSFPIPDEGVVWSRPRYALDMGTLPGAPHALVVSTVVPTVSPDYGGTLVFDHGMMRPIATRDHTGARRIEVADDTTAWGYNDSSTEYGLRELAITDDGIEELWVARSIVTGFNTNILYEGGRIYSTRGHVVDPTVPVVVGSLPDDGPVAVDPDRGEIYVLTGPTALAVYDLDTLRPLRTLVVSRHDGTTALRRWGEGGLVLASAGKIRFIADP